MSRLLSSRLAFLAFAAYFVNSAVCAAAESNSKVKAADVPKAAVVGKARLAASGAGSALPLVFEENVGQLPAGTAFAGRTANYTVQVLPSELRFGLPGNKSSQTITIDFTGSDKAKAVGKSEAAFRTNFYVGSDPRGWHTGVRNYNRVALRALYPGIDAEFYSTGNDIEHDFFIAPGSDASRLAMHLAGAKMTTLSSTGDVVLAADEGALKLRKPTAYQVMADGTRKPVPAEFVLVANGDSSDLSFKLGEYDHARELVIDPVITYATYVAGNTGSTPTAVASDVDGNVYITGSTTSTITTYGASGTNSYGALTDPPAAGSTVTFIARVSRATTASTPGYVNGSQIAWLTYYGDGTTANSSVVANAIGVVPGVSSPALYIAGQTNSKALPGLAAADTGLSTGASTYGFIAQFNSANGSATGTYTSYVDGGHLIPGINILGTDVLPTPAQAAQATTLNALSVEAGAISVAGSSTGTQYNGTSTLTGPSVPSDFCGSGLAGTRPKGLLATFTSIANAPTYSTYVCGSNAGGNTNVGTALTGISASTATANVDTYILAGSTDLDFPMGGAYGTNGYFTPGALNTLNALAASITHDATTATPANNVNWSYWSHGNKADAALGLTVDPTGIPNVLVFGYANSPAFASSSEVSTNSTPATPAAANTTAGYNTYNGSGQQVGFAVSLSQATGAFNGLSLLAGTGTSKTSIAAGTADGVGNVLLTGSTNGTKASFPLVSTVNGANVVTGSAARPSTVSTLSALEDRSLDPAAAGGTYTDGFLVRMPSSLVSADYVAFFGPASASGASAGVGVAVDAVAADSPTVPGILTTPPAYVLLNETPGGSSSFTNSAAEEQVPQAGATHAAYLAQVGFVAPTGTASLTYPAGGGTYTPHNPVTYSTAGSTHFTLSWTLNVGTAGTSQLTFNLPQSRFLATYTAGQISATVNGNEVGNTSCTLGQTNPPANPAASATAPGPGFTCVIPIVAPNMSGSTVVFSLTNAVVTSAITPGSPFSVAAAAYDATGVGIDLTQSVATTGVPVLTVNVASTPALVDAAASATQADAAGYPVKVTYTYTVTNSSDYDSPQTKLVTNLNTTTPGTTLLSGATFTPTPAGCDPTTAANGCDVPAHGSLKYVVTGVYLDQNFVGVTAFPYTVTQGVPTVAYSSPSTDAPPVASTDAAPSVQVNGTTTVTANAITTNTPTYANGTSFQLGDGNVQLIASFTNSGNNLATSYKASVLLPKGYTAASSSCAAPTGLTTCTFSNIPAGQTVSFTITGSFNDTGTTSDAVAPPATASDPLTNAKASASSGTVTAKLDMLNTGLMGSTYVTSSAAPPDTSIKVTRVNALTYSITAKTPLASSTVNEFSPVHSATTNDQLAYTVNVRNGGISAARGLYFSIPVPNAPSGTVPTLTLGTPTSSAAANANLLTCALTAGASPVVCYTNDLKTTPAASTATTIPQTYSLNFTVSYNEAAVPQTVKTTQITQGNGTIFAAADTYNPANGLGIPASVTLPDNTNAGSNVITIQRATNVTSTVSVSAVGSAAATSYADKTHITLDSNVSPNNNLPGVFDTAIFQSATSNTGINDAAGLTITFAIPGLSRVAVPQYCTLNGVTGPTTTLLSVASATTMTCTTPATTTPAGGQTQQLRTSAAACAAAPVPTGGALSAVSFDTAAGNCFQVAFYLKYVDSPTIATVVGANTTGAVTYSGAIVVENDIDTPSTPAATATAAVLTVQRAAHLRLMNAIAAPTYTTGAALTLDASGVAQAAEAAQHMDPVTRLATSGKVFNCLRYTLNVQNEGPNYVLSPSFGYKETPTTFVPTQYSVGTAAADANYVNCSTKTTTTGSTLPALAPYITQNAFIDGYYDLNSFAAPNNSGSATFSTTGVAVSGYLDSDTTGTAAGDFIGSRQITLVNTPANTGDTSAFGIIAYGTTPQASLVFSNVSSAGITSAFTASTVNCTAPAYDSTHPAPPSNVNICFPYGNSPVPKDANPTRNLYQPGAKPQYYQLPTTATVPASTANNTSICFTMTASPFLDTFVKPERVLLWVMSNSGSSTKYNTFPAGYSGFTSPLAAQAGDVTTLVTPYLASGAAGSYTVAPASYTFPQIPQSQPLQVCGAVNGLTTTKSAAVDSVASAETFGVLEPVNFPPVAIAGSIAASSAVSKGSTSALLDIYLQRAVGSTLNSYDYDDRDPCYTLNTTTNAITRQQCDDNPYLYEVTFLGRDSTIGAVQTPLRVSTLQPENVAGAPSGSYHLASNINLSATTNIFVAIADQATGADAYSTDIGNATLTPNYGGNNPFQHQGDFLSAMYSIASGTQAPVCDPGNSFVGGYNPLPTQCNTVGGTTSGVEGYVLGGSKTTAAVNYKATPDLSGNYYLLGNVGDQSVTASSLAGSGLIPLPYPGADPTTPNPPNAASPATANISAGQTAGFAWLYLSGVSHLAVANGSYPGDQYKLSCFQVDAATQNTAIAFSTGVTCSITTTTLAPPNDPSIYTFADSNGNNGSSYPTIYVTTSSKTFAGVTYPAWRRVAEGISLAMLFPVFFLRRRLGRAAMLATLLVTLAASSLLTGCGSGGPANGGSNAPQTAAGRIYLRVKATPLTTTNNEQPIVSAPFIVSVQ